MRMSPSPRHGFHFVTVWIVRLILSIGLIATSTPFRARVSAQSPASVEFDVVSIKRNTSSSLGNAMRTLPDGTQVMTNTPVRSIILGASPVQTREVIGLPDWAMTERYDFTMKPPPGATPEQRKQMMQAMFADRLKLVAHIEQRERNVYMLVLARGDGRLGPELKLSTLDCGPRPAGTPPPAPPPPPASPKDVLGQCGMMMGPTTLVSGGMPMNALASSLYGLVGGDVENRTGLEGFYAFMLTFARQRGAGAPLDAAANTDDAPDIFTAVQEQLGLKLQREKRMMPVFVIDHIERPSEN
jgi:uncharacterized protein (TIGR03435 family)